MSIGLDGSMVFNTAITILCAALAGCAAGGGSRATARQVSSAAQSGAERISPPQATPAAERAAPKPTLVPGTGVFTRVTPSATATEAQGPVPAGGGASVASPNVNANGPQDQFQLSFVDTDIGTVISSVLGEGLGLSYVVDPALKGTMTLQASRPLSRDEVLPALENALRFYGAAMVDANGVYNIVPLVDARRRAMTFRKAGDPTAGFGIEIVPLQYVSAADVEKTLRSVASEGAIVRVDEGRNLLLLAGTSQERAALLDVVRTFDVDWLAGMSFAIFPFEYVDAKTAAEELGHVFADEKSPIANVVRFIPLSRLNSLLVVSHQPQYLKEIETWIRRLDVGVTGTGRRIYVYDVQNGKADELAKSLSSVLMLSSVNSDTNTSPRLSSQSTGGLASNTSTGTLQVSPSGSSGSTGSSQFSFSDQGQANTSRDSGWSGQNTAARPSAGGYGGGNSGISIAPNAESNSLMILASPSEFAMIEAALKRLDVLPLEVMIEATLAEVTLNDELRFGLQWSYKTKQGPAVFSDASSGAIAQQFPGLSFLYTGSTDISAVLSALETVTRVKVLSSPKLLVLNNREAELKIGDQVPVITQSAVGTLTNNAPIVNSVELKDTGVILKVLPRVNKNGLVTLEVSQEVSDVGATTTSAINSPTIHQRQMSSTVEVRDGQTIALGGLIRENSSRGRDGIPFLSRLPLLGYLFGSTTSAKDRTELIVLLTPHVVRSNEDSDKLMQDLQSEFKALRNLVPAPQREDGKPPAESPTGAKRQAAKPQTVQPQAPAKQVQDDKTSAP